MSTANPSRPIRAIPKHAWESHREEITKLYLEQDRKLLDIQAILLEEYGFNASYAVCYFI